MTPDMIRIPYYAITGTKRYHGNKLGLWLRIDAIVVVVGLLAVVESTLFTHLRWPKGERRGAIRDKNSLSPRPTRDFCRHFGLNLPIIKSLPFENMPESVKDFVMCVARIGQKAIHTFHGNAVMSNPNQN